MTLALDTQLPNQLLGTYLRDNCPELVKHQHRVQKALFPSGWPARLAPPSPPTLLETVRSTVEGWWPFASPASSTDEPVSREDAKKQADERNFKYARWAWFAGASAALVGYVLLSGIVTFDFGEDEWDQELWDELEEAMAEEEEEMEEMEDVAEALEEREPTSRLPVWDDEEDKGEGEGEGERSGSGGSSGSSSEDQEGKRGESQPEEKNTGESGWVPGGGLPVWEEGEDEREQEPKKKAEVSDAVDPGPLHGEPSVEEEIIEDFDPASAQG